MHDLPILLDVREVAAYLGMHPDNVRKKMVAGEIPGKKIGRQWKTTRAALAAYVTPDAAVPAAAPPSLQGRVTPFRPRQRRARSA